MSNLCRSSVFREAVILAGGFGTRLSHIVSDVPKPMAPVAGRPFMRYVLDMLAEAGFERVVIADGYKRECIENYFGDCYRGLTLVYSQENGPLLTGGATKLALEHCCSPWVYVLNGDTYLDVDFGWFEKATSMLRQRGVEAFIAGKTMTNFDRYGTVLIEDGLVTSFQEKRRCESGVINAGVYLLRRDALEAYPDVFSLETGFLEEKAFEGRLGGVLCEGTFIDIGVPEDYGLAQTLLAPMARQWRLAIFDRDGTINEDLGHTYRIEDLRLIEGAAGRISEFNRKPGWKVVVATNQAGIAKGLYTEAEMMAFHRGLNEALMEKDAWVDAYYFCPHHPDHTGDCACRKPKPGMLKKALFDFEADPSECIMFGDRHTDVEAATAAGIRGVLL